MAGWGPDPTARRPSGVHFTVRSCVGRLLEVYVRQLRGPDDLAELSRSIAGAAQGCASPCVIFGDHRRTRVIPPDVTDAWSRCMRTWKYNVAMSAILLDPENEPYNLQLERIVRCACNEARQVFYAPEDLREWIAPELTLKELTRLDELMAVAPQ
jgi:hypothetical protein